MVSEEEKERMMGVREGGVHTLMRMLSPAITYLYMPAVTTRDIRISLIRIGYRPIFYGFLLCIDI